MNDEAISFNSVIDNINQLNENGGFTDYAAYCCLYDAILYLPLVTPQRPTGHWIEGGYDDYKWVCSECGYPRYEYYEKPKAKYCECCGCSMEIER